MSDPTPAPTSAAARHSDQKARGYLASTVKHGGVYAIGTILTRLVGFIMLPVYTHILTAADYGVLEILSLTTDILSMLVGLGVRQAVLRYYYRYDTETERNAVISTAAVMLVAAFLVVGGVGMAVAGPATDALLGPGEPLHYFQLAIAGFALQALADVPLVYLQARQRSGELVTSNLIRLVIALSLNILFVVVLRIGVAGIFLSTIIASLLVGGVMMWRMLRETGLHLVGRNARELLAFGAPLMVLQLGSFILHFSDRYFLRYDRTLEEVGVYALSYKLAMMLGTFVIGPFYSIWTAKSLEIARREGEHATPILASIMRHYNLVLVSCAFGLALFSTDVVHLAMGEAFQTADRTVPVLAIGMVFFGYRQISQVGAMIAERPGFVAWSSATAAAGAILLNLTLIPRYGAMGAAISTMSAFGLEFFIMRALSLRVHPVTVPLGELFAPMAVAAAVWGAASLAVPAGAGELTGLGVRLVAALGYALLIVVTGILTADERRALKDIVRDPRSMLRSLRQA